MSNRAMMYFIGKDLVAGQWIRGPVAIQNDEVIMNMTRAQTYVPGIEIEDARFNELSNDFFDIGRALREKEKDFQNALLRFAKKHSLLFHVAGQVCERRAPNGDGLYVEKLSDWRKVADHYYSMSLLALGIHLALRGNANQKIEAMEGLRQIVQIDNDPRYVSQNEMPNEYFLTRCSQHLANGVSLGLTEGVLPLIESDARFDDQGKPVGQLGVFLRTYGIVKPIAAPFYRLATNLAAGRMLSLCEDCGRPFHAKHSDARFCAKCQSKKTSREKRHPELKMTAVNMQINEGAKP